MRKKKKKGGGVRGPGALFMHLYRTMTEFKRTGIHIQFHILPGQMGNFPHKRFLNI